MPKSNSLEVKEVVYIEGSAILAGTVLDIKIW